uniref:RING-type domain-containing protein n=1 Tax=Helicotheca tamesis TaxID=374047 RepID=A0A7S2GZZ3_9STRA|mmetsp:Transcript_13850/g.18953  ORF Transcript_13850/g.18953 Transcript_13850/m.18953 type:complete len:247 (+) Transcript_13850:168-908(+)
MFEFGSLLEPTFSILNETSHLSTTSNSDSENDEKNLSSVAYFIFGFFLFWNSVVCIPTTRGLSGLLRGECNQYVVHLVCPHWLIGFIIPFFAALNSGLLLGYIFFTLSFVLPYSIAIFLEILKCLRGERRWCPHLPTRQVHDGDGSGSRILQEATENTDDRTTGRPTLSRTDQSKLSLRINTIVCAEDDSARFCSICLEDFHTGEEIGMSMDVECKHIYHKDCITEWLEAHDNCPICRRTYITSTS